MQPTTHVSLSFAFPFPAFPISPDLKKVPKVLLLILMKWFHASYLQLVQFYI